MNEFSITYFDAIINVALEHGYKFVTLREFDALGCPPEKHFVLRHDLDTKPTTLKNFLDCERNNNVKSSIYVRVTSNEYNLFDYRTFPMLLRAELDGHEIGLHSNFVEYAKLNSMYPREVLTAELAACRAFFQNINTIAPHRDTNYMFNSLPWLQENQNFLRENGIIFHSYEEKFLNNTVYVNEGLNPHICWRDKRPEDVVLTGKSIYMLTHSHWWYLKHAFE